MKQRGIYRREVEVKGKSLTKESTRSKAKKKNVITSIPGVSKCPAVEEQPGEDVEYM